jgi:hypothetical protein
MPIFKPRQHLATCSIKRLCDRRFLALPAALIGISKPFW